MKYKERVKNRVIPPGIGQSVCQSYAITAVPRKLNLVQSHVPHLTEQTRFNITI